jgi:hypothetical protein
MRATEASDQRFLFSVAFDGDWHVRNPAVVPIVAL